MDLSPRRFSIDVMRDIQYTLALLTEPSSIADIYFFGGQRGFGNTLSRYPSTNMVETPDTYELNVELPGYDKKNLKIDMVDKRSLVLSGSIKQEYKSSDSFVKEEEDTDKNQQVLRREDYEVTKFKPSEYHWLVNERVSGSFTRSFSFPTFIDDDDIKASYNNGILKVSIPKANPSNVERSIYID